MRHLLCTDHRHQPIVRLMFGELEAGDTVTSGPSYVPTHPRPEYARQLRLLTLHAQRIGAPPVLQVALRVRPEYTETVPVLVTALRRVQDPISPDAEAHVEADCTYITGDDTGTATVTLYTPLHGQLRPAFATPADHHEILTSGTLRPVRPRGTLA